MNVRVLSLGAIVQPKLPLAIAAFARALSTPEKTVLSVMHANMGLIDEFKLGQVDEETFKKAMIDKLATETGVKLTTVQFDTAWNAMNPGFLEFAENFIQAVEFNKPPAKDRPERQRLVLVSYTNPLDIKHLIAELKRFGQRYDISEDGELISICGIKLHCSYVEKRTKAQLIDAVIKEQKASRPEPVVGKKKNGSDVTVIYVTDENCIEDPVMRANQDKVMQSAEQAAQRLFVPTIYWNRETTSLYETLRAAGPVLQYEARMG